MNKWFIAFMVFLALGIIALVLAIYFTQTKSSPNHAVAGDIQPLPPMDPTYNVLTNSGRHVLVDPSADIHMRTNLNFAKPFPARFYSAPDINQYLAKLYSENHFDYQSECWQVALYWKSQQCALGIKFSIVMPVYNQEAIIVNNLKSVFEMTQDLFEVIVICDGCSDKTQSVIIDWWRTYSPPPRCIQFVLVHIKDSIFETACDNIGFKLSSGPMIVEIQADMTMTQHGYNEMLAQPLYSYDDIIGVSGRCTHDDRDSIGLATMQEQTDQLSGGKCYLMASINRGPLLLDRMKLIACGFLDEGFVLGNDDHDLFYRAWTSHGFRACYVKMPFISDLKDGTTRKPMAPGQKRILQSRKKKTELKFAQIKLPVYRNLQPSLSAETALVTFGNAQSIHWSNVELAMEVHARLGIQFDRVRLYNDFDVRSYLLQLPSDAHHSRGHSYWAWKPWIIYQSMLQLPESCIVVYMDAGMYFKDKTTFQNLMDEAKTQVEDYTFFSTGHNNSSYCKCELIQEVPSDTRELFRENTMINAALLIFRNTAKMRDIVLEWLRKVQEPFMVSDESSGTCINTPDFKDHRHDQAVLSFVIRRNNLLLINRNTSQFANHHRIRTPEDSSLLRKRLGLQQ